jgi:hypothetical protein
MSAERAAQLVDAGIWLRLSGDVEGARRLFERALKLDPLNAKAQELMTETALPTPSLTSPIVLPSVAPAVAAVLPMSNSYSASAVEPISRPTQSDTDPAWKLVSSSRPESTNRDAGSNSGLKALGPFLTGSASTSDLIEAPLRDLPFIESGIRAVQEPEDFSSEGFIDVSQVIFSPPPPPLSDATFLGRGQVAEAEFESAPTETTSVDSFIEAPPPEPDSAWEVKSNPSIEIAPSPDAHRAMDLLSSDSRLRPSPLPYEDVGALLKAARGRIDLDDHTGAMDLIVRAEKLQPYDAQIISLKQKSEATLLGMLEGKLTPLHRKPRVLLKDDEIIWLNLDHRAGFVLAQIDGTVTFEDVFSVSGMSRLDTARILVQLTDEGVISRN